MKFLFVCGGSAGHINPALAIAEELRKKIYDAEILFVGADKTLEKRLIPKAGFQLTNINMSGLSRGFSPSDIAHNIKTALNLFTASFKADKLLKEFNPDVIIGTGGYICYPVIKRATKKGIPAYILEPNACPGLTVKMLDKAVDGIFVTYKGIERRFSRPEKVVYTGTPLSSEFNKHVNEKEERQSNEKPLVVSYWGSVGATEMNNKIINFIARNSQEQKFNHIHATGIGDSMKRMKEKLEGLGIKEVNAPLIDIREYIDNMPEVLIRADLALTRAGASTIAELKATGTPAILVPSPNVTENHQEENALKMQNTGGAVMITENDCNGDVLFDMVTAILNNKSKLQEMARSQKSQSVQDSASRIIDIVTGRLSDSIKGV
ncbi:MAG: UDP-N-acetylglucosamine--N-acetylmuramyl-(pentapeptide) pyrophosphoryl-undecaprenol N-acetylglucosamine transferase [Oscillospiraceae bacterium]|nr:UDP-N-acetylglucosamine--N-acetylmuramyl-(pentapeptide) pyrophosphoryl-undecaprenol N-acetylglucosamine transferase [Oscillospiraceae bacterium]